MSVSQETLSFDGPNPTILRVSAGSLLPRFRRGNRVFPQSFREAVSLGGCPHRASFENQFRIGQGSETLRRKISGFRYRLRRLFMGFKRIIRFRLRSHAPLERGPESRFFPLHPLLFLPRSPSTHPAGPSPGLTSIRLIPSPASPDGSRQPRWRLVSRRVSGRFGLRLPEDSICRVGLTPTR